MIFNKEIIEAIHEARTERGVVHLEETKLDLKGIFDWKDVNHLLSYHNLRHPQIRLVKEGKEIEPSLYLKPESAEDLAEEKIDPSNLYRLIANGATLNINCLHRFHPPLRILTEELSSTFKTQVRVNGYMSWIPTSGYETHWDGHDVMVVQITGKKKWFVYPDPAPDPFDNHRSVYTNAPTEPAWTNIIKEGDILFVPRGFWHRAEAMNEPSLHLTFGIHPLTPVHYMESILKIMEELPEFRQDLSCLSSPQIISRVTEELTQKMHALLDQHSLGNYLRAKATPNLHGEQFGLPYVGYNPICPLKPTSQIFLRYPAQEKKGCTYPTILKDVIAHLSETDGMGFEQLSEKIDTKKENLSHFLAQAVLDGILYIKL